jgi:apolipoprotein N-acyltransferase
MDVVFFFFLISTFNIRFVGSRAYYFFYLLLMNLSESHNSDKKFNGLTWVVFIFYVFLINFLFHISTLCWLEIEIHNFLKFFFYGINLIS